MRTRSLPQVLGVAGNSWSGLPRWGQDITANVYGIAVNDAAGVKPGPARQSITSERGNRRRLVPCSCLFVRRIGTLPVEGRCWGGDAVGVRAGKAGRMAKGGNVSGSGVV